MDGWMNHDHNDYVYHDHEHDNEDHHHDYHHHHHKDECQGPLCVINLTGVYFEMTLHICELHI